MPGFMLSIRRVDAEVSPTVVERLLHEEDWPFLPRVGERITVGRALMLDLVVDQVCHEEGVAAVDLGTRALDDDEVQCLVNLGWIRRAMPRTALLE